MGDENVPPLVLRRQGAAKDSAAAWCIDSGAAEHAPAPFLEGSVVWANMPSFPDWPAVVRSHEDGRLRRESNARRLVHVEFLGDGRAAWVPEKELRPFRGADAFKEIRRAELARVAGASTGARKAAAKRYLVSDKNEALIRHASEQGEALAALPSLSDRLLRLKQPATACPSRASTSRVPTRRPPQSRRSLRSSTAGRRASSSSRWLQKTETKRGCFAASGPAASESYDPCGCATGEGACADEAVCSNRAMAIECDEGICKAGRSCENRCFEAGVRFHLVLFHTGSRGWGVRSIDLILKGAFVVEYAGERINSAEYTTRLERKQQAGDREFYFLAIDKDHVIDSERKGNIARFVNHSCAPNCLTQTWDVHGERRVAIFATQDIRPGTELTIHYYFDSSSAEVELPCFCGADVCEGFLGKPAKKKAKPSGPAKKKAAKTGKRQPSEDFCFRCNVGGDLLCCGRPGCPKVYHLNCAGEQRMPCGHWDCPWHYCEVCPARSEATAACVACPNAFCAAHMEGRLALDCNGNYVCKEHDGVSHYFEE